MAKSTKALFLVKGLDKPVRLDRALRDQFPRWGRQAVQQAISAGKVRLNGRAVWIASWEVHNGDRIEVANPPVEKVEAPARFEEAWILREDDDLIAVNKPAGLLSEPTRFSDAASLLSLAQSRFGEVVLFHRLDRDTSGVVILTRPGLVNKYLDTAFKSRAVHKQYLAVVSLPNRLERSGVVDARIGPHPERRDKMAIVQRGGQHAVTRYEVMQELGGKQLVRLWPETGRTHQLRVHLAHLGAPIVGDRLYGVGPKDHERLLLHAQRIELPEAEGFPARTFEAPIPQGFWRG